MAEVKDKVVTVESLAALHDYDENTFLKTSGALTTLGITATADELNKLDGVTATTAELNYVVGVNDKIQNQIDGKAPIYHSHTAEEVGAAYASHSHLPEVITAHMGNEIYPLPVGTAYSTLPLTTSVKVGTALTMENNTIKIGADINTVRISAQVCVGSSNRTEAKYLAVRKNGNVQLARGQVKLVENTTAQTVSIATIIVNVAQNDLLTLDFYGVKDDTIYGGINLTYITVEKLA